MSIEVKVGQVWRSPSGTELAILRVCEARCEGAAIHGPHAHTAGGEGSFRFFLERCTLVRDALPPAPEVGQTWRENATDALCEIVEVRGLSAHVRQLGLQTVVSLTFNELRDNFSLYGALICRACGVPTDGHGPGCSCSLTRAEAEGTARNAGVPLLPSAPPAPAVPWRAGQRRQVARPRDIAEGVIRRRDDWTGQPGDDHWLLLDTYGVTYAVHERMFSVLLEDAPVAPAHAVDWSRWAPPAPYEAFGPMNFKEGQVWASRWRDRVYIFRVLGVDPATPANPNRQWLTVEDLFMRGWAWSSPASPRRISNRLITERCILVQDVGQAHPPPPEVLYAVSLRTRTPTPEEVPVVFADVKIEFTGMRVSDLEGQVARSHRRDATAGCRLGCACLQHRPPREPWVPAVDDFDLLPDA